MGFELQTNQVELILYEVSGHAADEAVALDLKEPADPAVITQRVDGLTKGRNGI